MGQGAYIFGCEGLRLQDREAAFFREADPLGFILFARNLATPDQIRYLTGDLRNAVQRDAPILIDQEGGRVQRLRPPMWRQFPPPLDQADAAGDRAEAVFRLRARLIAQELMDLGIDVDCIPDADLAQPATHEFLKNRCYGRDVDTVVRLSRATVDGLMAGGVLPVMKHIPGHGRSVVDTHFDLPRVTASADELDATDFAVFRKLNDLPMAMTAHLVYEAFDRSEPATMSPRIVSLIRQDIGFDGLLMSDDISMGALSGDVADRSARVMAAGVDVVLHCNGDFEELARVADACGAMGAQSQARADAALGHRPVRQHLNIAEAEQEFQDLVGGGAFV